MSRLLILFATLVFAFSSCSKDKTVYEDDTEKPTDYTFSEAIVLMDDSYKISVETINGKFYKGYNEIRLKLLDSQTDEEISPEEVLFNPVMKNIGGKEYSCPHRSELQHSADNAYYSGYVVFTKESDEEDGWSIEISFINNDKSHSVKKDVLVQKQPNSNLGMVAFTGNDGQQYYISLVSPFDPVIAENELIAGVFVLSDEVKGTYLQADNYVLKLDPRMPDPSMGNHSSPNNKDLTQREDGLYQGKVNYTMKGNWTLNFILFNKEGERIKGTEVPEEHMPGVVGTKSELHIDVKL